MVNVTDRENIRDHSCLIEIVDHESITIPSAIYYKKAKTFSASGVARALKQGDGLKIWKRCSDVLLKRIIEGAFKSDDFNEDLLDYLR